MTEPERVYTLDESSGRAHVRVRIGGRVFAQEQCNADDAGGYVVLSAETFRRLPPDRVCGHCRHVAEPPEEVSP